MLSTTRTIIHRIPSRTRIRYRSTSTTCSPPSPRTKPFYATTPIFYVNADPHIGHLHSTLLADIYTRWNTLRNPHRRKGSILSTGTDEHGLKIQRVAEGKGIEPGTLCDQVSQRFKDLTKAANIDYRDFIRTTEPRHRIAVQHVWRRLEQLGYIYKSSYSGWYAVSDEAYYGENQVERIVDSKTGEEYMASIETGTKVEWMEEENYKFRLSAFRDRLIEWLSSEPNPVQPPSRTQALLSSLHNPTSTDLTDLSISRPRSRLTWGIPVPGDETGHTIYVWIDALVNYLTVAGYPWNESKVVVGEEGVSREVEDENKVQDMGVWPPDLQVVGKDIIRFHALYLPAVLMALDLPLPLTILSHGHWTMDKFKMSKSRGNVIDPFSSLSKWSVDGIRMYLMRNGGNSAQDADWSEGELEKFYRKDLGGQMGNLVNRVTTKKLVKKVEEGGKKVFEMPESWEEEDTELVELLKRLPDSFSQHLSTYEVHKSLSLIFDVLSSSNRHFQLLSPWLPTTSVSSTHRALYLSIESLRMTAICLQPFMPTKSQILLDALGIDERDRGWDKVGFGMGGGRERRGEMKGIKGGLWPPPSVGIDDSNL